MEDDEGIFLRKKIALTDETNEENMLT